MIRCKLATLVQAALLGTAALLASASAHADMCALDQRPAATLLVPFFEVDLAGTPGQGRNTRFWVRNMTQRPRLTNVTLWTTWGIPAFAFNVYLPAFGTQRLDLGALFLQGTLPKTGSGVTPIGAFDSLGTPLIFATCNGSSTPGEPPVYTDLSAGAQAEVRARFRGTVTSGGQCFGENLGDDVARGYVTIDDVNACTVNFYPADPGYFFPDGGGTGTNANTLLGGVEYVDPTNNIAHSMPAYGLEAQDTLFLPGDISFYSRFMAQLPYDGREPLPFSWSFEFDSEITPDADDADLMVFRAAPRTNPRSCTGHPPWFPLDSFEQVPFDRSGNTPANDPFPLGESRLLFSLPTQTFPAEELDTLLLDPLPRVGSGRVNFSVPIENFPDGQSLLSVRHTWQGRFSEMQLGRALDTGCPVNLEVPARVSGELDENPAPPGYIFYDSFSS
jgi:hypothetical protein